jgi:hypothetical protein
MPGPAQVLQFSALQKYSPHYKIGAPKVLPEEKQRKRFYIASPPLRKIAAIKRAI